MINRFVCRIATPMESERRVDLTLTTCLCCPYTHQPPPSLFHLPPSDRQMHSLILDIFRQHFRVVRKRIEACKLPLHQASHQSILIKKISEAEVFMWQHQGVRKASQVEENSARNSCVLDYCNIYRPEIVFKL